MSRSQKQARRAHPTTPPAEGGKAVGFPDLTQTDGSVNTRAGDVNNKTPDDYTGMVPVTEPR